MLQALSPPPPTSPSQVRDQRLYQTFGNLWPIWCRSWNKSEWNSGKRIHRNVYTNFFCVQYLLSFAWWQQWDLEEQLWVQLHRDHRTRKARIVSNPTIYAFLVFLNHITAVLVHWSSSLLLRGRFSVTKRCDQRGSKRTVAAKYVSKKLLRREQVLQEIRLLQTVDHPNLVKLLDTYETANSYVLVLEMWVCLIFLSDAMMFNQKNDDWLILQGRPGTFLGLRSELGQPHRGEGGTVPQRNSWSSSLPARLEDSAPRPQSKWLSFMFPHKQPTSLLKFQTPVSAAWEHCGGTCILSAGDQADRLWWRRATESSLLVRPSSAGEPRVLCPWAGPRAACLADVGYLEFRSVTHHGS